MLCVRASAHVCARLSHCQAVHESKCPCMCPSVPLPCCAREHVPVCATATLCARASAHVCAHLCHCHTMCESKCPCMCPSAPLPRCVLTKVLFYGETLPEARGLFLCRQKVQE
ncbi:hypothetical protein XENTR_v10006567 [Xenopus tropicalis]|nr:hypothetical protein XENTR_v10006567 [Xenopus tropicalis]